MNTLSNIDNYFIPNTLDGINIIQDNINDNALLVDGTNAMLADLDAGGFNIKNLDAGIANNEAVNVGQLNAKANITYVDTQDALKANISYVDTQDNLKVNKSGDTMTGQLNMNNNNILNCGTITSNQITSNKQVRIINSTSPSTRDRIFIEDNVVGGLGFLYFNDDGTLGRYTYSPSTSKWSIDKDGNFNTVGSISVGGNLNMNSNKIINLSNGTNANDAVNFSQLTAATTGNYVQKSGDTMTGTLNMNADLVLQGATTQFVPAGVNPVDVANRTNTYIAFGEAGAGSDFAYLRQIGGSDNINLSIDFHDTSTDGIFSLRSVPSISNPDGTPNTFFQANSSGITVPNVLANAGITISRAGTTTDAEQPFRLQKNNNYIGMNPYFTNGSYNGLVKAGDKAIIFSDNASYNSSSGLVIAPHNFFSTGIRIDNNGLTVNGGSTTLKNYFKGTQSPRWASGWLSVSVIASISLTLSLANDFNPPTPFTSGNPFDSPPIFKIFYSKVSNPNNDYIYDITGQCINSGYDNGYSIGFRFDAVAQALIAKIKPGQNNVALIYDWDLGSFTSQTTGFYRIFFY